MSSNDQPARTGTHRDPVTETNIVHTADCRDVLPELPGESIDAIVTDPPYAIALLGHDWDDYDPDEYQHFTELWARDAYTALKPGGYLLTFGSPRTHHREAAGIEDAGYEIRDTITWHHSEGYPSTPEIGGSIDRWGDRYTDADTRTVTEWIRDTIDASDATAGDIADRLDVTKSMVTSHWAAGPDHAQPRCPSRDQLREILDECDAAIEDAPDDVRDVIDEIRDATGEYSQHYDDREVVAEEYQSPSSRTDIGASSDDGGTFTRTRATRDVSREWEGWVAELKPATEYIIVARKPLSEDAAYKQCLETGTGALNVADTAPTGRHSPNVAITGTAAIDRMDETARDRGSGARDYYPAWDDEDLRTRYRFASKPGEVERTAGGKIENSHNTVKPVELMQWLVELTTREDAVVLDPFAGSGTTLVAARELGREWIGIERDAEYADIARARAGLRPRDPTHVRPGDDQTGLDAFNQGESE